MNTEELLAEAAYAGITLRLRRGQLITDAPESAAELNAYLADKSEVIRSYLEVERQSTGTGLKLAPSGPSAPTALSALQTAYRVGETDYPELATPAHVAHLFETPELDVDRWTRATREVLQRHPALRLSVRDDGLQEVRELRDDWTPVVLDWTHLSGEDAQMLVERERQTGFRQLPPLDQGPQLLCNVYLCADTAYVLIVLRLFALDGRSIGLVSEELARAYRDGGLEAAPSGDILERYARGVEAYRGSQAWRNDIAHWERSAPLPPPPAVPVLDRPKVAHFARLEHRIDPERWQRLQANARRWGLSASSLLCAAYADVLRRWSGNKEFTITALVSTRPMVQTIEERASIDGTVGNFGTTVLLACMDGTSFADRARALQSRLLRDASHSIFSGVDVARRERTVRSSNVGSPFVFASGLSAEEDYLPPHLECEGWRLVSKSMQTPQVLLDHQVSEYRGALVCTFDFVADAFPDGLVSDLVAGHEDLLRRLDDEGYWTAERRPPLPASQLKARSVQNATTEVRPDWRILDRLAQLAREQKSSPALIGPERSLDYAELDQVVRRSASGLRADGVKRGDFIGILMERGIEQCVAALAVLGAGATFVPLSVDWPPARIRNILDRHGIRRIVVDDAGERLLPGDSRMQRLPDGGTEQPTDLVRAEPDDAAYVIFTSGSTGAPKGVVITHASLQGTVDDIVRRFSLSSEDRILSLSAFHFDLSMFDLFGAILAGAAVIVPPASEHPDPQLWVDWLVKHEATVWNTVPALFGLLIDHSDARELTSLRLILLSGDWVPVVLARRTRELLPHAALIALGGATEAAIWSCAHPVVEADETRTSIPYGAPLTNQRFYVVASDFAEAPSWVPGELLIAGDGLAREYLGEPGLTAASFTDHPVTGERVYRTGDQCRYLPDGTLEFLGRLGSQVKVRGYRVDLSEIEFRMGEQEGVASAAAVVVGDNDAHIVAFYVPSVPGVDGEQLRRALAENLPGYALPAKILALESLPLTPNGKRDVAALRSVATLQQEPIQPTVRRPINSPEELLVSRLWSQAAGLSPKWADEDFFALGGTSVGAVRLAGLVDRETGKRLPVSAFFESSTLAAQAALLSGKPQSGPTHLRNGQGAPIVLVHPVGGHLLGYRPLLDALPPNVPVVGFELPPVHERPAELRTLARRYASTLTSPVHLVGWSMGGVIAAEMANSGLCQVISLTVIDSTVAESGTRAEDEDVILAGFVSDLRSQLEPDVTDPIQAAPGTSLETMLARHLPREDPESLRPLFDDYTALYTMLLAHQPSPLPQLRERLTLIRGRALGQTAEFGLIPIEDHPARLVPSGTRVQHLDGTHYSIMQGANAHKLANIITTHTLKKVAL
ncbi:non-ribosomal peptide synthetase [Pseudarthrobacter oxydans]|uniref:non-ribosomal peptide synthetase n=1 Tax=Pseudarthrobacter oxydans TaxID=1671 RepID=UPI003428447C